jgi:hypothetical protein
MQHVSAQQEANFRLISHYRYKYASCMVLFYNIHANGCDRNLTNIKLLARQRRSETQRNRNYFVYSVPSIGIESFDKSIHILLPAIHI